MPFVLALVLLLSACGGQTTQGESKPAMDTQTQVSEPAVNQQQSGIDFEIGLRNVKIDTEGTSLTDAQKQVLQFFDTDYLSVYDYEFFRRYPNIFIGTQMTNMGRVYKVLQQDKGVTQPAIVRPREDGGYEIVSGHRRQKASELAGFVDMPCIVRDLTDEQAITQMVEDNTNQRENILPSERAKALKMQLEAIKHQGAKEATSGQLDPKDAGRRSNEIVAERNKMTVKQVQR